jgi:hypothetical protein
MTAKEHRLGILFVHGIGSQLAREVLVSWGDSLVKTINLAARGEVVATVREADPGVEGVRGAEAVVQLQANAVNETWLICEGWWADAFPVPTYAELVGWSVGALPWSITLHVAQEYWERSREQDIASTVVAALRATMKLLVALLLTPLSIALLAVSLLLGWLPVPQVRSWILATQGTLANTIGDSLVFVDSPVRAALIRTRILGAIEQLKTRCERTIVIAHSQGAAVVVDALGGIGDPDVPGRVPMEFRSSEATSVVPDTLLTFGAGINPLAMLKVLASGQLDKAGGNPTWLGIGALTVGLLVSWFFYAGITTGSTTVQQILLANGFLLMASILLGILAAFATRTTVQNWFSSLLARWPVARKHQRTLVVWAVLLAIGFAFGVSYLFFGGPQTPVFAMGLLWLVAILLAASCTVILSKEMKRIVTVVQMPAGLKRWVDLYGSADPVPNGPIITVQPTQVESYRIWNLGSVFADHTSYWSNMDGFVLRVVRLCAETAGSPWTKRLPAEDPLLDARADWRVKWLRWARWSAAITLATFSIPLWVEFGDVPLPWTLPTWLPAIAQVAIRYTALAGAILAAIWLSGRILRFIWELWVRFEQKKALAHDSPGNVAWYPLSGMMILILTLVSARVLVWGRGFGPALDLVQGPDALEDLIALIIGCAFGLTRLLMWLLPAPRPVNTAKPSSTATTP